MTPRGSSAATAQPPAPEFIAAFLQQADETGTMNYERFTELALYHPEFGYYRRDRRRVGYGGETDFFTASTSGPLFGELVSAACVKLLGAKNPRDYAFVEIGAETNGGILSEIAHPFGAAFVRQIGDPLVIPPRAIVFSNELFDAQPFRRFVVRDGKWREIAVTWRDGALGETLLVVENSLPTELPAPPAEGYHLDLSFAVARLTEILATTTNWNGLFVAFDYGKSWRELATATPAGTARAYYRHTQHNDLLARPGEQDLTTHVCWDWIETPLVRGGFLSPTLESQEAFFVHHADRFIAATIAAEAASASPRKLALMQLLHPGQLGQKFQVLHACRETG